MISSALFFFFSSMTGVGDWGSIGRGGGNILLKDRLLSVTTLSWYSVSIKDLLVLGSKKTLCQTSSWEVIGSIILDLILVMRVQQVTDPLGWVVRNVESSFKTHKTIGITQDIVGTFSLSKILVAVFIGLRTIIRTFRVSHSPSVSCLFLNLLSSFVLKKL